MVDVYLLSGFLGSGKTSLLKDLIRQFKEEGKKPAVVMNEYGKLPFDSNAVEKDVPLKEMLEGCICCSGSEKVEAQIQSLLSDFNVDVILIETTGAAHPVEALDSVYSPIFANQLTIKGIVTVTDSKLWLNRQELSPQVKSLYLEQIRHAHLLLANKSDLLTEEERSKVTFELQSFNPSAPVIQTTNGKLPLSFINKMLKTVNDKEVKPSRIGHELHLSTRLVKFTKPVRMEDFEAWVKTIPSTIYRMKGFVPVEGKRNPMVFQYAYGIVQWLPEDVKMEPQLVIIGENVGQINVHGVDEGGK